MQGVHQNRQIFLSYFAEVESTHIAQCNNFQSRLLQGVFLEETNGTSTLCSLSINPCFPYAWGKNAKRNLNLEFSTPPNWGCLYSCFTRRLSVIGSLRTISVQCSLNIWIWISWTEAVGASEFCSPTHAFYLMQRYHCQSQVCCNFDSLKELCIYALKPAKSFFTLNLYLCWDDH